MRRRRQQKLEKKLQQFRSRDGGPDTGGTLKIYGESLCRDVPYKTLLLSIRDCAQAVVREMLAKYGMDKVDPLHYCLVQVSNFLIGLLGRGSAWCCLYELLNFTCLRRRNFKSILEHQFMVRRLEIYLGKIHSPPVNFNGLPPRINEFLRYLQVNSDGSEYILDDDECPLSILMNHPTSRGKFLEMFCLS